MDFNKQKNNTLLIIPFIIKDSSIVTQNKIKSSYIEKIGFYTFMHIVLEYSNTICRKLENEPNIYNFNIDKDGNIDAIFVIPKCKELYVSVTNSNGFSSLSVQSIVKIVQFWKTDCFDILDSYTNKNTQTDIQPGF